MFLTLLDTASLFAVFSYVYLLFLSWPMALRCNAAASCAMIMFSLSAVFLTYRYMKKSFISEIQFNFIDILFFANFLNTLFSVFYSSNFYASLTEVVFLFSCLSAYILFRIFSFYNNSDKFMKICSYLSGLIIITLLFNAFVKKSITADGRLYFNMLHPNLVGSMVCILCAPLVYNLISEKGKLKAAVNGIAILLMAYLIVLTASRGALAGFIAGSAVVFSVYAYCNWKTQRFYRMITAFSIATVVLGVLICLFAPAYLNRILSMADYNALSSGGDRLGLWKNAWNIFSESPIMGTGAGTFAYQIQKYDIKNTFDAHNFILDLLTNTGVLGLLLYLAPIIFIIIKMVKRIIRIKNFKSESLKESENVGYAIDTAVLFVIVSVHLNSLFTPHLTFMVTAMPLYALYGLCSSLPLMKAAIAKSRNNKDNAIFNGDVLLDYSIPAKYNNFIFMMLALIGLMIMPVSYNLYAADVSNFNGVNLVAQKADFNEGAVLFSAASTNWGGVPYLLNSSFCILLQEFIKPVGLRNPAAVEKARALAETAKKYNPYNKLIKEYIQFVEKATDEIKNRPVRNARIDKEIILSLPQMTLNSFVIAFGKDAHKEFSVFNEKLIKEILEKSNSGAGADVMGNYSSYLGDSMNYAVNFDIAGIDEGLAEYIKKTASETQKSIKYLPFVEYDYRVKTGSYAEEKMVVTTGAYILPMIWKFGRGLDRGTVKANLDKLLDNTSFADMKIMPVVDYFIYGLDTAEIDFQNYGDNYNQYWKTVKSFADGRFEDVIKNSGFLKNINDKTLSKMGIRNQNGYILLSWAQYKLKNYEEAKRLIYQSLAMTIDSKYEYSYKAGLLFEGKIDEFFRPSLYSYYDQSVMMALIRANKGDHKKILPEIFDYLNAVIFN